MSATHTDNVAGESRHRASGDNPPGESEPKPHEQSGQAETGASHSEPQHAQESAASQKSEADAGAGDGGRPLPPSSEPPPASAPSKRAPRTTKMKTWRELLRQADIDPDKVAAFVSEPERKLIVLAHQESEERAALTAKIARLTRELEETRAAFDQPYVHNPKLAKLKERLKRGLAQMAGGGA